MVVPNEAAAVPLPAYISIADEFISTKLFESWNILTPLVSILIQSSVDDAVTPPPSLPITVVAPNIAFLTPSSVTSNPAEVTAANVLVLSP